jgi:hypothetical protein
MKLSFERRDTASRLTTLVAPLIALAQMAPMIS